MSKFVTKKIEAISGMQEFRQLIILDEKTDLSKVKEEETEGQWDKYLSELETKYIPSANRLLAIMNKAAKGEGLPDTQFKELWGASGVVKEYEVKAGDLRAYAIKVKGGKLVILGGYKNNQDSDIRKLRSLKEQYLESIKPIKNDKKRTAKK